MMRISVENAYGIRNEKVVINSNCKKNMFVFAPNGIGKTSLFKAIKNAINQDNEGINENDNSKIDVTFKGQNYIYEWNKKKNKQLKNDQVIFVDGLLLNNDFSNLKEIMAYNGDDGHKAIDQNILNFWGQMVEDIDFDSSSGVHNYSETQDCVLKIESYLKNKPLRDLGEINKDIEKKKVIINVIDKVLAQEERIKIKTIGDYALIRKENEKFSKASENHLLDVKIINDIKRQKQEQKDDFGYKENTKYNPISEISKEWIEDIQKSFSENEIELILLTKDVEEEIPKKNNGTFNQTKGKLSSFKKIIKDILNDLNEEKLQVKIHNNAIEFYKLKANYDGKTSNIVEKINLKINKINKFFLKSTLDWKIKIAKIKSIADEFKINFIYNDTFLDRAKFDDYASTGQKRVLWLIASLIDFYEKDGTLIIDDPFLSLDNHHINEILEVISDEAFEKVDFLFFSHNFEWLRSFAFHESISSNTEFIIFDKGEKEKFMVINAIENDLKNIMHSKNINLKGTLIKKLMLFSSLAREVFANYLLVIEKRSIDGDIELNKMLIAAEEELKKVICFLDANLRHYKGNITLKNLKENLELKISKEVKKIPLILKIIMMIDELIKKNSNNKILGDLVRAEQINWNDSSTLSEYTMNKIFLGIQIRFQVEFIKFYSRDTPQAIEVRKLWESGDWREANNKVEGFYKNLNSYKINYLAHANNVQWNKIIEIPIYKILKIREENH